MFDKINGNESSQASFPSMLLESDAIPSLDRSKAKLNFV